MVAPSASCFDRGGGGIVIGSRIENNGGNDGEAVHLGYSSTAQLDSNTILAKAEGVNLDFSSSLLLSNNTITATTGADAARSGPG